MSLILNLVQECLNNVTDAAGTWQIEAGKLIQSIPVTGGIPKQVGNYSTLKRTSCGTTPQNTAMLWSTLFFTGSTPPENITLHGSLDWGTNGQVGSVSAASSSYATYIGQQFNRVGNTLTIA